MLLFAVLCGEAGAQALQPLRVIDVNALRGNAFRNALGLGGVAIDGTRNLAYVYARHSGNVSVVDIMTGREVRLLQSEETALGDSVTLDVNATAWMLLARGARHPEELLGISTIAGTVIARYRTPRGSPITGVAVDAARNRVFVADGTPVIRVLDGTSLLPHDSISSIGNAPVGAIAFDSARAQLTATSAALVSGKTRLQTYDGAKPHALSRNLSIRGDEVVRSVLVSGKDRSMLLCSATRVQCIVPEGILDTTIRITGGILGAAIDEAHSEAIVVDAAGDGLDGLHRLAGKLHLIDLISHRHDSLRIGNRLRGIAMHQQSGRLILASEGDNRLLALNVRLSTLVQSIDPGESADALAWDEERAELYVADARGDGDGIAHVTGAQPAVDMLRSGTWPAALAFDPVLHRLFSIDHCECAGAVFDVADSTRHVSVRIPGILEARSPDLSHLALDPASHLLLACVPERSTWALVDGATARVLRSGLVDGYSYQPGGGAGRLQGAIDGAAGMFVVLRVAERLLNVYRISDGALLSTVELASPAWDGIGKADAELLYIDAPRRRLFVGPVVVDMDAWAVVPRALPFAQRIIGSTQGGAGLLGLAIDDSVRLTLHRASDLHMLGTFSLAAYTSGTPVVHVDSRGERLFLADPDQAIVREYSLSLQVGIAETGQATLPTTVHVYPQPAADGSVAVVEFATAAFAAETGARVLAELSDVTGRVQRRESLQRETGATMRFPLETAALLPGVYALRLSCGRWFTQVRILVTP